MYRKLCALVIVICCIFSFSACHKDLLDTIIEVSDNSCNSTLFNLMTSTQISVELEKAKID